jgi:uncharacterized YkwD family protein/spore coat assembly protein SafA
MFTVSIKAGAETKVYTVLPGDTMWKIAVKYQAGISEIIAANPQVKNPALIYPGQKLTIPLNTDVKTFEMKVVDLVNHERTSRGLQPLANNWQLERVARYKANDMANNGYFSHISPTYGSPFNMMEDFGIYFSSAGENIAMGQRTPEEVVNAWMNSSGHRANILSAAYTQIGVGYARNKSGMAYWSQMFIKPTK